MGLPSWVSGKEFACQCRRHKRLVFDPWVGKISWNRKWQSTPVFLPGRFHGQRSLAGSNPWGCKGSDTTERMRVHTHTLCDLVGGHLKLHFKLWWKEIVCSLLRAGSCTHIQAHICMYTQRTRWNFKLWSADIKWHYQFFGLLYLLVSGGILKPLSKTVM